LCDALLEDPHHLGVFGSLRVCLGKRLVMAERLFELSVDHEVGRDPLRRRCDGRGRLPGGPGTG
jgi:hypothetical protein